MSKHDKQPRKPAREDIAACAQIIYEMEGRPEGRAMEHWLLAEALLIEDAKEWLERKPVQTTRNPPVKANGTKRKLSQSPSPGARL
jgi:hypothetical protein